MQVRIQHIANFAILFILILGYSWLVLGAYYAFPNSEDLALALDPREEGIIKSVTVLLRTYDGRYFTNILHGLNPLAFNWFEGHRIVPLFAIVFCIGSLSYFLKTCLSGWFSKFEAVTIASAVYLFHFWTVPSLAHELYWMVSSFVYLYPLPFIFLWVSSTYQYLYVFTDEGWKRKVSFLVSALLLWAAIGLNEMFLSVNLAIIALGCYYFFRVDRNKFKDFTPLALIGISSIMFFVFCPGPWQRMIENSPGGGALFITERLVRDASTILFDFSVMNWTAFSFVLGIAIWYSLVRNGRTPNFNRKKVFWVCACLVVIGLSTLFPYYVVMNEGYVPYRVYGSFVFVLHAIMLILSMTLVNSLSDKSFRLFSLLKLAIGVIAFVYLCADTLLRNEIWPRKNNIALIKYQYMSGTLQKFESEMKNRYKALKSKDDLPYRERIIPLKTLSTLPHPVYHIPDIYANGEDVAWNVYWEDYFEVNEILVSER